MEGYLKNYERELFTAAEGVTLGPGLYRLDNAQRKNTIAFPWAPNSNINLGNTFLENDLRVDFESDLRNITRHLTNDPKGKYVPQENVPQNPKTNIFDGVNDGFFHIESSRLTNPAFDLKGMTKNRWISLKKNPQENVIEPFKRNGFDTYSDLLDNYRDCPVQLNK